MKTMQYIYFPHYTRMTPSWIGFLRPQWGFEYNTKMEKNIRHYNEIKSMKARLEKRIDAKHQSFGWENRAIHTQNKRKLQQRAPNNRSHLWNEIVPYWERRRKYLRRKFSKNKNYSYNSALSAFKKQHRKHGATLSAKQIWVTHVNRKINTRY